ncbi:MAG: diguanylate cyclase domain-containing protein [Candidatus Hodarchaeales archaeon]|jgi:GGDEF domain-containing protein
MLNHLYLNICFALKGQIETPITSIEKLTSRLKLNLKNYNKKADKAYQLSISIGISRYNPENPCSLDKLLSKADKLMYKQKKHRKNH